MEAAMQAENIPAVSVAILYQDSIHYINRGYLDRTQKEAVTPTSIYQIASLGKIFVGIITHHLLLEEKIQLEQKITDFLPANFPKKRQQKLEQITIEHLLHHRSGLPQDVKVVYKRKDGDAFEYNYTEENLLTELRKLILKTPGKYQYSNFGYALLAYILEKASNKTYEELLRQYITEPYQLQNTAITLNDAQKRKLVTPYRKDKRNIATSPWQMGKLAPPSAIYSTVEDLSKLMKAQLIAYQNYKQQQQISPLVLTTNTIQKYEKYTVRYGYGFNDWNGDTFGHTGDMDGYASDYSITLGQNTGMVILTSSGEDWIRPLIQKIHKILSTVEDMD